MSKLYVVFWLALSLFETVVAQQNNPYACLGEAEIASSFRITEQSLEKLKSEEVPSDILRSLVAIKGKEFVEEQVFLNSIRAIIGDEETTKFKSKILEHASRETSVRVIRQAIRNRLDVIDRRRAAGDSIGAKDYCIIAELMKRIGDYRAPDYYNKAIDAGDTDPIYHLFLAEYWRNFRGAQHPVFPKAEKHYYLALRKREQSSRASFHLAAASQIERGLVALYQEDGVPFLHYTSDSLERPYFFFSTVFSAARNTSDFDRRSEVRDFTSESLFSRSSQRLNRNLTEDELRRIIRVKDQFETFNRLRFRYKSGPAIDFSYKRREINQAQVTNFFEPNKFNDAHLSEYGVAAEKSFDARAFDLFLRGSFKRARRLGIIEFLPRAKEDINQVEANAVLSRFVGPDKANIEFTYVFQDIREDRPNPLKRDRSIYAGKFTYQLFRQSLQRVYKSRFETRGIDLFGGVLHDNETFGVVDVNRDDYFVGASLKGFKRFDFTVQPTVFTAEVENDPSQKNSQLRTNATMLFRILDEEREPRNKEAQPGNPAFLHILIPFSRDVVITGPNTFENYKLGVGLNAKLFATGKYRTTFLASIRYDYQNFHRLGERVNLYSINFSMGF